MRTNKSDADVHCMFVGVGMLVYHTWACLTLSRKGPP